MHKVVAPRTSPPSLTQSNIFLPAPQEETPRASATSPHLAETVLVAHSLTITGQGSTPTTHLIRATPATSQLSWLYEDDGYSSGRTAEGTSVLLTIPPGSSCTLQVWPDIGREVLRKWYTLASEIRRLVMKFVLGGHKIYGQSCAKYPAFYTLADPLARLCRIKSVGGDLASLATEVFFKHNLFQLNGVTSFAGRDRTRTLFLPPRHLFSTHIHFSSLALASLSWDKPTLHMIRTLVDTPHFDRVRHLQLQFEDPVPLARVLDEIDWMDRPLEEKKAEMERLWTEMEEGLTEFGTPIIHLTVKECIEIGTDIDREDPSMTQLLKRLRADIACPERYTAFEYTELQGKEHWILLERESRERGLAYLRSKMTFLEGACGAIRDEELLDSPLPWYN